MTMNKKRSKRSTRTTNKLRGATNRNAHDKGEPKPVTLAQALTELFEGDLHPTTGTSRHTAESYRTTFRLLLRFLEEDRSDLLRSSAPVECFDTSVVEAFLRYLSKKRGCTATTVNVRRAAFGALARSLIRRHPHLSGYCQSLMAIRSRRAPEVLVGYFEVDELEAIFDGIDTSKPDGFRDLVMLRLLYNTGARASELCGLHLTDLRLDEPAHAVLHGKGGKTRAVPLWPITADLLRAYLKAARRTPKAGHGDFVFIGRRGNGLTRQGLYKVACNHLQAAARKLPKLDRPELHPVCSFRHTTATHLLMAGVSLPEIQEILGHARPDTTRRYRTVNLDRKRQALERLLAMRKQKSEFTRGHTSTSPEWADSQEAIDWLERL